MAKRILLTLFAVLLSRPATRAGDPPIAEQELRRALDITSRAFGSDHIAVASYLHLLAELSRQRGDLETAIEKCQRALTIVRHAEMPLDALHANLLHSLAVLYRLRGKNADAVELLQKALDIDRTSTGEECTAHLDTVVELAQLEAASGDRAAALDRMLHVLSAHEKMVPAFASLADGPSREALLAQGRHLLDRALTLVAGGDSSEPAARQKATATGSQRAPTAAGISGRLSRASIITVESPATPPPGLSQRSASTTGCPGIANASAIASSGRKWRGPAVGPQARISRARLRASAFAASPSPSP